MSVVPAYWKVAQHMSAMPEQELQLVQRMSLAQQLQEVQHMSLVQEPQLVRCR